MNNCIKKCLVAFLSICFACSTIGCQKEENPPVSESKEVLSEMTSSFSEVSSEEESDQETSSEINSDENTSSVENSSVDDGAEEDVIVSAKKVVDEILTRPDAWSFLPEAFQEKNMAYTENTFPVTNFTQNTQISAIGDRFIGSQLMVLYDGLLTMQDAFERVDVVFAIGESLAAAYQTFINDNPNDYALFATSLGGFNIKLELDGKKSTLLVGNSVLNVELHAAGDENTNCGRIQMTNGITLKYEMSDNSLIYAYQVGVGEAMRTVNMSFARNEGVVAGYIYEFTGVKGMGVTTTAVFSSDEDYTKVIAKKRESKDLIVLGNEEVYDSKTGEYVSGVVSETLKLIDFETYWLKLSDVSGFQSIKVVNDGEKNNVYVNGGKNVFATKNMSLVNFSRRFDIEMKTVYYVKTIKDGADISYELVKTEIPMLFAQTQTFEELGNNIQEANASEFSTAPIVTSGIAEVALEDFETLKGVFDTIQVLTYEDVVAYIGEKNAAFES